MLNSLTIVGCSLLLLAVVARQTHAEELHPLAAQVAEQLGEAKGPFVMVVVFKVAEGQADNFLAAMQTPIVETRKEQGNLAYDLHQNPQEPASYLLFEKWESLAALDSHLKQPYLVELGAKIDSLLVEAPQFTAYLPIEPQQ